MKRIISLILVSTVAFGMILMTLNAPEKASSAPYPIIPKYTTIELNDRPFPSIVEIMQAVVNKFTDGSINIPSQNYAAPITHLAYKSPQGHLFDVTAGEGTIALVEYDSSGHRVSECSAPYELPLYGGFFRGDNYIYIVFGQDNIGEDDNKEVFRVVKYDDRLNRLGSASLTGGQSRTVSPFYAGTVRFAENGNELTIATSRKLYVIKNDDLNHQANYAFTINTSTMTISYRYEYEHDRELDPHSVHYDPVFVSHSLDQYVLYDGNTRVFLDLSDDNPGRGLVIHESIVDTERIYTATNKPELVSGTMIFSTTGWGGANYTGISPGGFELSETHYIAAFSSIDMSNATEWSGGWLDGLPVDYNEINNHRSVFVATLPRLTREYTYERTDEESQVGLFTVADYFGTDKSASAPQLLRNADSTFTVLWERYAIDNVLVIEDSGNQVYTADYKERVTFDCAVAQRIDANGKSIGSQREYPNREDFYKEYLGASFFPDAPELKSHFSEIEYDILKPPAMNTSDVKSASPTTSNVFVDGIRTPFEAYNIEGSNYFRLRDIAYTLNNTAKQFSAIFEQDANAIVLSKEKAYIASGGEMSVNEREHLARGSKRAVPTSSWVFVDGVNTTLAAYNIDGYNYVKMRDLAKAMDFYVEWDGDADSITVKSDTSYQMAPWQFSCLAGIEEQIIKYAQSVQGGDADESVMEAILPLLTSEDFASICRVFADWLPVLYKTDEHGQWMIRYNKPTSEPSENFAIYLNTGIFENGYLKNGFCYFAESGTWDGRFSVARLMTYDVIEGTNNGIYRDELEFRID